MYLNRGFTVLHLVTFVLMLVVELQAKVTLLVVNSKGLHFRNAIPKERLRH